MPTNDDRAMLLWAEAERTDNLPTLCAATGLIALMESATSTKPMPLAVAQAALSLIVPSLIVGLGIDHRKFLEFALSLAETRLAAPDEPRH